MKERLIQAALIATTVGLLGYSLAQSNHEGNLVVEATSTPTAITREIIPPPTLNPLLTPFPTLEYPPPPNACLKSPSTIIEAVTGVKSYAKEQKELPFTSITLKTHHDQLWVQSTRPLSPISEPGQNIEQGAILPGESLLVLDENHGCFLVQKQGDSNFLYWVYAGENLHLPGLENQIIALPSPQWNKERAEKILIFFNKIKPYIINQLGDEMKSSFPNILPIRPIPPIIPDDWDPAWKVPGRDCGFVPSGRPEPWGIYLSEELIDNEDFDNITSCFAHELSHFLNPDDSEIAAIFFVLDIRKSLQTSP